MAIFAGTLLLAGVLVHSRTVDAVRFMFFSPPAARHVSPIVDPFLIDLEERTFRFFWDTANPKNGLIPDRYPTPSYASIAAVGFALTAYPVGVERGYVTREQARQRVLRTLRFLYNGPQGPHATGMTGYKGFYYHFLDMKTGVRFEGSELSTVDTAILLAGALFCQTYFDGSNAEETEIRHLVDEIYRRVDWHWAQPRAPAISHGWTPEDGYLEYDWRGYNEAMLVYLLALGSPTHPVGPEAWTEWTSTYDSNWHTLFGQQFLTFSPLFGHQYTHVWLDFRKIQDAYMRRQGIDYFENSRRAIYAQQAYAIANPLKCKDYGATIWGITASDGPAEVEMDIAGGKRKYRAYSARGIGGASAHDDCTLAPTATVASIPFAPELAIAAVLDMNRRFGQHIYSTYGFLDAFNPSFDYDVPLQHGQCLTGFGWVDNDYLGIDQGAIFAMIENYRSEMIWRVMHRNSYVRRGLERAGFSGGWLTASR
ncbi:MAG TPA: glucoamylase family protein [Casimicrobiaceae bacterium]|nr:glucoamylase family protein [Casimicrobiaceae bacterium]